ncbi:MAG: hypothetical protein ACI935_001248 [Moritella dasanensis]|jgi:hypothetical protein
MIKLKLIGALTAITVLAGCATHGEVYVPVKVAVENQQFVDKSIATDIFYSQPKPGFMSGGEMLPMKPINEAEVSVGASRVLARFKELFAQQLPMGTSIGTKENSDFTFVTELQAKDKSGPSYADYDAAASFGKKLITLGLGSSEYTIIADFDITYKLLDKNGDVLTENTYSVNDEIDHERGGFDGFDIGEDLAAKLFEKHVVITMNQFFEKTSQTLTK